MKIIITGSIAYDYLMTFPGRFQDHFLADHLDQISVSFLVDSMRRQRGGVAPNIAYTNALLGGTPGIMATAGNDFGAYGRWLEKRGVDISGIVVIEDEFCSSFFVNTDQDQNQIATFYPGAMARAADLSFAKHAPGVELAIISPNAPEAMCAYVTECKGSGIPYIYDPSQQTIRLSGDELNDGLTGCRMMTVNQYELRMIEEKTGLSEQEILARAGSLLVTMGKKGALIKTREFVHDIPPVSPDHIVDPTGAGDAFRGGMLRGLQLGLPLELAGRIGSLAATYVLENIGTQGHSFTRSGFVSRYISAFGSDEASEVLRT